MASYGITHEGAPTVWRDRNAVLEELRDLTAPRSADYDLEAIADGAFRYDPEERGFICLYGDDTLWDIIDAHDISGD